MAIELTDDGTLDTVLRCSECGEEFRFNYDGCPDTDRERFCEHRDYIEGCEYCEAEAQKAYDDFVAWAIEEIEAEHSCASDDPTEPEEGDITTTDYRTFYQDGKLVLEQARTLTVAPGTVSEWLAAWFYYIAGNRMKLGTFGDDHTSALRAYMDRTQYWPNCWFISDHGNAHLIDLSEVKP